MIVEIISILYGVASMTSWGFADFLAKRIVGTIGHIRLLIYIHLVGLAPLFLLAVIFPPSLPSSLGSAVLVLASGIITFLAAILWYRAVSVGKVSIISPMIGIESIVALILSFIILGEILSVSQVLCIALVIAGVLIISRGSGSDRRSNAGIPYALAAMLLTGLHSIIIKLVSIDIGGIETLIFNRALVTLMFLLIVPFVQNLSLGDIREKGDLKSIIVLGLIYFLSFFTWIVGVSFGIVSIIVPIAAASPAVTIVLARLFLKEKLTSIQKMAVTSIILGILILSILSSG